MLGEVAQDQDSSVDEKIEILDSDPLNNLSLLQPQYQFQGVDNLQLLKLSKK